MMFGRSKKAQKGRSDSVEVNPAFAALRAAGDPGRGRGGSDASAGSADGGVAPPRPPAGGASKASAAVRSRRKQLKRGNSIPDFYVKPKPLPPPPGAGTKDIKSLPPPSLEVLQCIKLHIGVPQADLAGSLSHCLRIGAVFGGYLQRLEKHGVRGFKPPPHLLVFGCNAPL